MRIANAISARMSPILEKKYDQLFQIVFEAIKQLLEADAKPRKKIGFTVKEKQKAYGCGTFYTPYVKKFNIVVISIG